MLATTITLHRRGDRVIARSTLIAEESFEVGGATYRPPLVTEVDVTREFNRIEVSRHEHEYRDTTPAKDL